MSFNPKSVRSATPAPAARVGDPVDGEELSKRLSNVTRDIPAATRDTRPPPGSDDEVVQINFRASRALARQLNAMTRAEGSTRRVIARLLIADGCRGLDQDLKAAPHYRFYGPTD